MNPVLGEGRGPGKWKGTVNRGLTVHENFGVATAMFKHASCNCFGW